MKGLRSRIIMIVLVILITLLKLLGAEAFVVESGDIPINNPTSFAHHNALSHSQPHDDKWFELDLTCFAKWALRCQKARPGPIMEDCLGRCLERCSKNYPEGPEA
ncbi:hypothetical protein PanWU01x14_025200 [Parasponia andersonii]|uniref:Transmembrane protein n=1 Tax=Parasponia andersonii TaxID=3476 RepID=A0A2P5DWU2_PARAD|nr:hypothetical protein PanWU01x14_025200 [Parasponia andersonii]